jgi:hypothetical protein
MDIYHDACTCISYNQFQTGVKTVFQTSESLNKHTTAGKFTSKLCQRFQKSMTDLAQSMKPRDEIYLKLRKDYVGEDRRGGKICKLYFINDI